MSLFIIHKFIYMDGLKRWNHATEHQDYQNNLITLSIIWVTVLKPMDQRSWDLKGTLNFMYSKGIPWLNSSFWLEFSKPCFYVLVSWFSAWHTPKTYLERKTWKPNKRLGDNNSGHVWEMRDKAERRNILKENL